MDLLGYAVTQDFPRCACHPVLLLMEDAHSWTWVALTVSLIVNVDGTVVLETDAEEGDGFLGRVEEDAAKNLFKEKKKSFPNFPPYPFQQIDLFFFFFFETLLKTKKELQNSKDLVFWGKGILFFLFSNN